MSPTPGNDPAPPPRRVRVTSPRTSAARTRRTPMTSEIDAQTRLGEIYMSSLLRAQLRLAGQVLAVVLVALGGLPLLFTFLPGLTHARLLGVPVPWLLLGLASYPLLLAAGWFYVRRAERNEQDFADVVERS